MRIDGNQGTQPLAGSERAGSPSAVANDGRSSSAGAATDNLLGASSLGEDQAQLSATHAQVQTLAAQAAGLPEVRQEKVNALRQVVGNGTYQPSSDQVANAIFEHMAVAPAA
jgi:flagellar biosynthesis anti-sigma factor FlgM